MICLSRRPEPGRKTPVRIGAYGIFYEIARVHIGKWTLCIALRCFRNFGLQCRSTGICAGRDFRYANKPDNDIHRR